MVLVACACHAELAPRIHACLPILLAFAPCGARSTRGGTRLSGIDGVLAGGAWTTIRRLAQAAETTERAGRTIRTPAFGCGAGGVGGCSVGPCATHVRFTRRLANRILVREQLAGFAAVRDAGFTPGLSPLSRWAPGAGDEDGGSDCGGVSPERAITTVRYLAGTHRDEELSSGAVNTAWCSTIFALNMGGGGGEEGERVGGGKCVLCDGGFIHTQTPTPSPLQIHRTPHKA